MIKLILKLKGTQIEEFTLEKDQIHIGCSKEKEPNIRLPRKSPWWEKARMTSLPWDGSSPPPMPK
jgi:hypothetical protein